MTEKSYELFWQDEQFGKQEQHSNIQSIAVCIWSRENDVQPTHSPRGSHIG